MSDLWLLMKAAALAAVMVVASIGGALSTGALAVVIGSHLPSSWPAIATVTTAVATSLTAVWALAFVKLLVTVGKKKA